MKPRKLNKTAKIPFKTQLPYLVLVAPFAISFLVFTILPMASDTTAFGNLTICTVTVKWNIRAVIYM